MAHPYHRRRPAALTALTLTAWSLALPLVGCYRYVPVATNVTPALGESSVFLTGAGSTAVQGKLGENVRSLDGPITRVTGDSIDLIVTDVFTQTRERFPQNGVPVTIARSNIEQVQTRTFSRKRTWGLVGAVVAVLVLALGASTAASASSGGDGGGGIQP
ncbi:hypothetical protein [Gemmatimonas sp.]|jgi:hypothetical protein|uniref:hypothetical protein n=1 Tax=Gemmatimonas sp. TaxID=1962908 RepID=UPI0037BFC6EC